MSIHEIESVTFFLISCHDCDFESYSTSPGVAEETAEKHIEEYIEAEGHCPNYNHTVEIREVRWIGRNI